MLISLRNTSNPDDQTKHDSNTLKNAKEKKGKMKKNKACTKGRNDASFNSIS